MVDKTLLLFNIIISLIVIVISISLFFLIKKLDISSSIFIAISLIAGLFGFIYSILILKD